MTVAANSRLGGWRLQRPLRLLLGLAILAYLLGGGWQLTADDLASGLEGAPRSTATAAPLTDAGSQAGISATAVQTATVSVEAAVVAETVTSEVAVATLPAAPESGTAGQVRPAAAGPRAPPGGC